MLIEFTVVRKRKYAERLENEMHYLRKAKSKSEEHSRELTTKLKRQQVRLTAIRQQAFIDILGYFDRQMNLFVFQRELFELQNRLSSISMSFSNENISSQSISDQSKFGLFWNTKYLQRDGCLFV